MVTAETAVGPEGNMLEPGPESCRQLALSSPVLRNEDDGRELDWPFSVEALRRFVG